MATPFVPEDFNPPTRLDADRFWLEPLGPQHNEADYAAWMSSIEHIRSTPGFPNGDWPHELPIDQNLADLVEHAEDFRQRIGFTYTVRSTDDDVIGCVYIYPDHSGATDAHVNSWVRVSDADLDVPLWEAVSAWLQRDWPFRRVTYAPRV